MVTMTNYWGRPNSDVSELVGLSTDTKPIDIYGEYKIKIANGSTFFCMDTGDMYMYDADNKIWHKIS